MTRMSESVVLDEMDDTAVALSAERDDGKAPERSRARRSLEEYLEKKALRSRLQDTYDDRVDLSELGW